MWLCGATQCTPFQACAFGVPTRTPHGVFGTPAFGGSTEALPFTPDRAAAASVASTIAAINDACKTQGYPFSEYSCQTVSWDDVQRFGNQSQVSSLGKNITDTRLWEKSGRELFVVRSQNWNEKLGKVRSDEVCLVAECGQSLRPITLRQYLQNASTLGRYAGLPEGVDLSHEILIAR